MPLPVRRKTTTPAARGGALVFIAACYKKNRGPRPRWSLRVKCSPPERALARGGGEAFGARTARQAKSVRGARRMKRAGKRVLQAQSCIDQAPDREFHAFRTPQIRVVAHRQPRRGVAPELGLK